LPNHIELGKQDNVPFLAQVGGKGAIKSFSNFPKGIFITRRRRKELTKTLGERIIQDFLEFE
jgi:hypothetical protein